MAIALVRQDTFSDVSLTDPQAFTLGVAPVAGNFLIGMRCTLAGTVNINAITQTNVTHTVIKANTVNQYCEIWGGVVGASAGTGLSVDLTGTSAVLGRYNFSEWSGLPANGGIITAQCLANSGTTTNPTTGTVTLPGIACLLIACAKEGGTFTSMDGTGWTALSTPNTGSQFAYKILANTTGTDVCSWTYTASLAWGTVIAALAVSVVPRADHHYRQLRAG